jgi:hypothetical protein
MPNVKIGVSDQSKTVSDIKIGVNDQAKKVVAGYIGVNGQAKRFWPPNKSSDWCQDQTIYLEPDSTYFVEIAAGGGGAGTTNWGNGTSGGKWSGNVTTTTGGIATYGIGEGCPVGVDPGGGDGSFISFPDGCSETKVFVGGGGCLNDSDNVGGGGGGYGGLSSGWNDALGNGKSNGQGGQGYSPQGGYGNVFGRGPTLIALGTCDKKIGGNSKGNSSRPSQAATNGGYYLEKSNTTALNVGGGGAGGVYNGSGTPQPGKDGWLIIRKL